MNGNVKNVVFGEEQKSGGSHAKKYLELLFNVPSRRGWELGERLNSDHRSLK